MSLDGRPVEREGGARRSGGLAWDVPAAVMLRFGAVASAVGSGLGGGECAGSDEVFGDVVQLDVGGLAGYDEQPEGLLAADLVAFDQDALGLADEVAGVDR